ncbi:NHL repeat-containing protein [Streptomyces iakyrus]|uniref:hypothetical protein n=1 Tax=Streptomyces iakyrus TaxID=68219 RepID=UPI0036FD3318
MYVSDFFNDRVVRVAVDSGGRQTVPTTGLSQPTGLALGTGGDLYVADSGNNRVVKVAGSSRLAATCCASWPRGAPGRGGAAHESGMPRAAPVPAQRLVRSVRLDEAGDRLQGIGETGGSPLGQSSFPPLRLPEGRSLPRTHGGVAPGAFSAREAAARRRLHERHPPTPLRRGRHASAR